MWYLALILMFINIVFYYSSKRDSKYKDGNLFLVTIPEYTIESIDVQKIIISYNRQLNILLSISFIISIISILLFNLFSANCDNLKIKYAKKALNIRGNKDTKGF